MLQQKIRAFLQTSGHSVVLWSMLVIVVAIVSMAIPPLQSPDEPDHIRRAYLLAHGQLVLDNLDDWQSGGYINTALTKYLVPYHVLGFPENQDKRLTAQNMHDAARLKWSPHETSYIQMAGTGYYFPLIYLPQALGLGLGELTDQTIQNSYRLARFFTLIATVALLWGAWRIARFPPIVAALFMVPMSIYQLTSASIDGLSNAMVVMAAALFLSLWWEKSDVVLHRARFFALCSLIFILVTSRYHLAGLLSLPLLLATQRDRWLRGLVCAAVCVGLFAWIAWVLSSIVDHRVSMGATKSEIVIYYLTQPWEFVNTVFRSVSDPELGTLYYESFLGRLGMLDVRYSTTQYLMLAVLLLVACAGSINLTGWKQDWPARCVLLASGLVAVPLAFAAMLLTWTPHPANVVYGIQGRYFIGPAIAIGFALYTYRAQGVSLASVVGWCAATAIGLFSVLTIPLMIALRFYIQAS